jgi:hypothetical protein
VKLPAEHGGATITYYETARPFFEVRCGNPDHGNCSFTKIAAEDESGRNLAQGRPMGAIAFWCSHCDNSRDDHRTLIDPVTGTPDQWSRMVHREFYRMSFEDFAILEGFERKPRDGEEDEPEGLP